MTKMRELILGTLSIILGIMGFASPFLDVEVVSKIAESLQYF